MFPSTLPVDTGHPPPNDMLALPSGELSRSLMQDLGRFEHRRGEPHELLEVLAACVRHTQSLAIRLGGIDFRHDLMLSVFPQQRLVHCAFPAWQVLASERVRWPVVRLAPATLPPPDDVEIAADSQLSPLGPWLWAVALTGTRAALLPELDGHAAYRVAPGVQLTDLKLPAAMADGIERLRRQTSNLREIAGWPGLGTGRAMRLVNALYLQSALIVSRSHPAATNEGWSGYPR